MNFSAVPKAIEADGLKVTRLFKECTNPSKVSLGLGVYRDDQGRPLVLQAVAKAKVIKMNNNINKRIFSSIGMLQFFIAASTFLVLLSNILKKRRSFQL